jgi:SAM-dependent methyltransferase
MVRCGLRPALTAAGALAGATAASGTRVTHWFEPLADHLGAAYLRYSFTKGTEQEVDFLVDALGLGPATRVLDVGCGPGRHANALGRRGVPVVGVDIARRFVDLAREAAPPGVEFVRGDARALPYDGEFDVVVCLCQGAFGIVGAGDDEAVLAGMARALKPGGRLALTAFSAYFQVLHLAEGNRFDAASGTHHERTSIKDEAGVAKDVDLWTTCYTPRELSLLAVAAGLEPEAVWSVEPGGYARTAPTIDTPEFMLVAHRPPTPVL